MTEQIMQNIWKVNFLETPWVTWLLEHEGWSENTHPKDIAKFWDNTHFTLGQKLRQVVGKTFAWCGATASTALIDSGYASIRSARAADWINYGTRLGTDLNSLIFGALVVIQHPDGSHHVTFFFGWKDRAEGLAILLGGNQSNAIRKSIYDLNVDKIAAINWPVKELTT